jgi:hypothetical protein
MLEAWRFRSLNALWLLAQRGGHRSFRAAMARPEETQRARLGALLRRNAGSEYGRRYRFDRIRAPREYQDAVPVVTADDIAPWIEAVEDGRPGVLTAEPVLALERTGGSTAGGKLIPYTASLLDEFRKALAAWVVDLWTYRPALAGGGAYWSVSPPARPREVTRGGVPVGFGEDTEYFGRLGRWALRRLVLTPPELARVRDMAASRYVTLRFLLETPRLTFISVWNPSFLTLLAGALSQWSDQLVEDIERGTLTPPVPLPPDLAAALARRLRPRPDRARELRALASRPAGLRPVDVWPGLRLISCWTAAAAARFLPELRATFPGVEVQGKGLLATEGVVSIPLVGHRGAALAVTSHFLEFAEAAAPAARPRLAHELEEGRSYSVILTTGGGLYRYALGDTVRVVGRAGPTPLVEFTGRAGSLSDLCGEKLAEAHVARVLDRAAGGLGTRCAFLMLAPEWGYPPYYALFVEAAGAPREALARLAAEVEAGLLSSPSYADCRRLGQLGPVRAVAVNGQGVDAYLRRCAALGQRPGSVKPAALHREPGWSAHLAGAPV